MFGLLWVGIAGYFVVEWQYHHSSDEDVKVHSDHHTDSTKTTAETPLKLDKSPEESSERTD